MIKPLAKYTPFLIMSVPNQRYFLRNMKKKVQSSYLSTPIKVAILIDGGFFIKRYNILYNKDKTKTPKEIVDDLYTIAHAHVGENNYLYRIFFYDCAPFLNKIHNPISNKCVDFSKTEIAKTQLGIFEELKRKRKVALRLGNIKSSNKWMIYPKKIKELLNHQVTIDDLTENDVYLGLSQKGIDMKIGVDIASLALKHFVDKIVLISGDSDFVPAAKLARREGIDFVLDPMHAKYIENSLYEHIDGLKSVPLPYPKDKRREDTHNKRKARIQKATKDDNNC